jgi:hypothetical protein
MVTQYFLYGDKYGVILLFPTIAQTTPQNLNSNSINMMGRNSQNYGFLNSFFSYLAVVHSRQQNTVA